MKLYIFLIICNCFFVFQALGQQEIWDKEAVKHIGEKLTVVGIIDSFKTIRNSKRMLLFCGTHYPEHYFTVIVENRFYKQETFYKQGTHPDFKGWTIGVTGKIIKYKGMPAVKVPDWGSVGHELLFDVVPPDDI